MGLGRIASRRGAARATLAIAIAWLALTLVTGVSYLSADVDSVKGLVQRAEQVAFGAWLVLLGWWASETGHDVGQPVGDRSRDRVGVP